MLEPSIARRTKALLTLRCVLAGPRIGRGGAQEGWTLRWTQAPRGLRLSRETASRRYGCLSQISAQVRPLWSICGRPTQPVLVVGRGRLRE
jgi:hypothetical protein